jgi:hypothetical protein
MNMDGVFWLVDISIVSPMEFQYHLVSFGISHNVNILRIHLSAMRRDAVILTDSPDSFPTPI